jgi:hypothetical protein
LIPHFGRLFGRGLSYAAPPVVLSDRTIREEIESGRIVIDPFEATNVQP